MNEINITPPYRPSSIQDLKMGDVFFLGGKLYMCYTDAGERELRTVNLKTGEPTILDDDIAGFTMVRNVKITGDLVD